MSGAGTGCDGMIRKRCESERGAGGLIIPVSLSSGWKLFCKIFHIGINTHFIEVLRMVATVACRYSVRITTKDVDGNDAISLCTQIPSVLFIRRMGI